MGVLQDGVPARSSAYTPVPPPTLLPQTSMRLRGASKIAMWSVRGGGRDPAGVNWVHAMPPVRDSDHVSLKNVVALLPPKRITLLRGTSRIAVCSTRLSGGVPEGTMSVHKGDPASDRDQIWLKSSPMISMRSCAGSNTAATDDLPDGGVPDGKSLVHPPPVNDHVQTSLFVKAKYPVLPPNITTRCRGAS